MPGTDCQQSPQDYHAIIIMGGPMGVYDAAIYPFLRQEHTFLQRAITQQVPMLGICLGSQLLARALEAPCIPMPARKLAGIRLISRRQDAPIFSFREHPHCCQCSSGTGMPLSCLRER